MFQTILSSFMFPAIYLIIQVESANVNFTTDLQPSRIVLSCNYTLDQNENLVSVAIGKDGQVFLEYAAGNEIGTSNFYESALSFERILSF